MVYASCVLFYDMAQVLESIQSKCTLFSFRCEIMATQFFQDPSQVLSMVLLSSRKDQNIVKIYGGKNIQFLSKYMIY